MSGTNGMNGHASEPPPPLTAPKKRPPKRDRRDTAPLTKWDAYEDDVPVFKGFEARSAAEALETARRVTQRPVTAVRLSPERHESVRLAAPKKRGGK